MPFVPFTSALNLDVKKTSDGEVMVADTNRPVVFEFDIKNLGPDVQIEFYNLVGFRILPIGLTPIKSLETEHIVLQVSPIGEFDHIGAYTFTYYIRDTDGAEIQDTLTFKRLKIEDVLEVGADEFDPESSSINVYVRNKENFDFGAMSVKFSSLFFEREENFDLGPKEKKSFKVDLNKEEFRQLLAGFYTMKAEVTAEGAKANIEAPLKFVEKDIIKTDEESFGLVVNTLIVKKTNEGNVVTPAQVSARKNIISRLFTTFDPQPDISERKGFFVTYVWNQVLNPGESLEVRVRTNWTFPLIIVLLVVIVVVLAKQYQKTDLILKKKVNFVRAKGGEFALKVILYVKAREYVERVNITERLPPLVKLYEAFGPEKPTKVDEKNRRVEWSFDKLEAGEVRLMSYVIYSKVGVFGKFALPSTRGVFERNGKLKDVESNKAFFVTEQKGKDEEVE